MKTTNEILTIPEVARYLKLSKSKVYGLVATGEIPHIRIGRNVRIREADLDKWIETSLSSGHLSSLITADSGSRRGSGLSQSRV
jgi:excisionase family DNA binding protein